MIKSFVHKGLERFFRTGSKAGIIPSHEKKLRMILTMLNAATVVSDMDAPGLNLHALQGNRTGEYSVTVSGNWRITFRFQQEEVYVVNYEDYH